VEAGTHKAEQSQRTRRRLVESATALFARKGYRDASIQEIADESGISRGSIFWHFGSKEGLLWAVLEELFARWEKELLVPKVGDATGIEAVRRSLDAYRAFLEGEPEAIRLFHVLMFEALGPRPDLAGEYARLLRHFKTFGAAWIALGVEAGEVRPDVDPHAISVAIVGALSGIGAQYLLDPEGVDLERVFEALARTLEHGLSK
jgi:TetR/AcrR family transcriptional regulator, acrAB operon repressor